MTRYAFSAVLAALSLASGAAFAQTTDQMVVKVGDLNLSSTQGATIARQRIDAAATQFCGGEPERDLGRRMQQNKCVAQMTGEALRQLDTVIAANTAAKYVVASRSTR